MSTALAMPVKHASESTRSTSPALPAAVEFRYTQTESFVAVLQQFGASLAITTYQANELLVARAAGAGMSTLVRTFDRPMGLAVGAGRLALTSGKLPAAVRRCPPRNRCRPYPSPPAHCCWYS